MLMASRIAPRKATASLLPRVASLSTIAAKEIDWDVVAAKVTGELNNLRRALEEAESATEMREIDWERYRGTIGTEVVDMCKEARESKIQKHADSEKSKYDQICRSLLAELKEAERAAYEEVMRMQKEVDAVGEIKFELGKVVTCQSILDSRKKDVEATSAVAKQSS